MVRGGDLHPVCVRSGERFVFGRDPHGDRPRPGVVAVRLPGCAPHVSGVLAELTVGQEAALLRWVGGNEGRLSSLLDAPGGARRVTLVAAMSAMLDPGKNELVVLAGKQVGADLFTDLLLTFTVTSGEPDPAESLLHLRRDTELKPHLRKGLLTRHSKEWYVALALAEPWLAGDDDSPFPPTNRRIYERVREWRAGHAWNLERPQRVDDAIRAISQIAFGELADPYAEARVGRIQNPRFAVGKRIAEYRLVTAEDLDEVEQAARFGRAPRD
ncbi:hypothetical protein BU204_00205 [Actinophytocola xanthii]|uniref:Uncharacterized protein n=2 Tax=Actinophytocola xanthii TaxID=1912961 RepID=A0A1Q8CZ51_9PSEU|nr:hypothetical protein BU204_00205 [Actinophytocola xanthii]